MYKNLSPNNRSYGPNIRKVKMITRMPKVKSYDYKSHTALVDGARADRNLIISIGKLFSSSSIQPKVRIVIRL